MSTYGSQILQNTGTGIQVTADGFPEWKTGGITIDWSTVPAVSADTKLPIEGVTVKNGGKYLRYGQIMTRIAGTGTTPTGEIDTIVLAGTRGSGKTFKIGVAVANGPYAGQVFTTGDLDGNTPATAAAVRAAIGALPNVGLENIEVTLSTLTYTLTFNRQLGAVTVTTDVTNLNGTATVANTGGSNQAGAGSNKFGPYDPTATDGRASLSRGSCFILNETVIQDISAGTWGSAQATDHPGVFSGGRVWKDRLLMTSAAVGSLALGPTISDFETAFPRISYVTEE